MLVDKLWLSFDPLTRLQLVAICGGRLEDLTLGQIRDAMLRSRNARAMARTIVAERRKVGS